MFPAPCMENKNLTDERRRLLKWLLNTVNTMEEYKYIEEELQRISDHIDRKIDSQIWEHVYNTNTKEVSEK